MIIHGADLLAGLIDERYPDIKAIFNNVGILLFPSSHQHREQKAVGLSYEDDSRGNALAAIEVRRHQSFTGERVRALWLQLTLAPQLSVMRPWQMRYGDELLKP